MLWVQLTALFQGFFITNFITFAFLILCLVPFRVQLVTACDKLHKLYFSKYFTSVFKKIHCVLEMVIGLYRVARQCRQFYAPEQKSKRNKQELNQWLIQTAPPTDKCTAGLRDRLILVLMESTPLLAPSTPQISASEEFTSKTVSQPPKPAKTGPWTVTPPSNKYHCS